MSRLKEKEILIVDDANDIRLLSRKVLENDGAHVREASSVQEAYAQLAEAPPSLILLDLGFTVEPDGFALLEKRMGTSWQQIPVIVFTGRNDKNSVVRAARLGASDYLLKPFKATMLLQKVRKALLLAEFQSYVFPEKERPMVQVVVPAVIQKMSEAGFALDTSAKLGKDKSVHIESDVLKALNVTRAMIKTSNRPAAYSGPNRYTNEILFTGIGAEFSTKLRRALKKAA